MTDVPPPGDDRGRSGRSSITLLLLALVGGVSLAAVTLVGIGSLIGLALDRDDGPGSLTDPAVGADDGPDEPGPSAAGATGGSTERYEVWEHNDDGTPVRWDPCTPIPIVLDPAQAPPSARDDLDEAVDRLRDATGLDLVVEGTSDERATGARPPYQQERYGERWAPVLVSWRSPGADGIRLRDTDRGLAVPIAVGPPGDRTYVTAQVTLNADRHDLLGGFDDRARSWGATLVHELAHALGLGHVDDPDQLMYVYPGEGPVTLGPGDRAGLAAVGAEHGCRDVPPAGPIEVADPPD